MKPSTAFAILLFGAACVTHAQMSSAPTTQPSTQPAASSAKPSSLAPPARPRDRYDVLVQRNIFMRHEGGPGRSRSSDGPTTRPSRNESWLLTGTAILDDRSVAFVENTTTGAAKRLKVGDLIDGNRVAKIESAGVDIEAGGGTRRVALGASFDGSAAPTTMPSPAGVDGGAAGEGGSSSEASILERLRARRNQEMNK